MADHLHTAGQVVLDAGAVQKLSREGKSLLPIGVVEVKGEFGRGAVITCVGADGVPVARGLSNYSSAETRRIMRKPSSEIEAILGFVEGQELIHRDNLVLVYAAIRVRLSTSWPSCSNLSGRRPVLLR